MTENTLDISPYIYGQPLDFVALNDARQYAARLPRRRAVWSCLTGLLMDLALFCEDNQAPTTKGQRAALEVYRFAMSGLYALLEDTGPGEAWAAFNAALGWARHRYSEASEGLSPEDSEAIEAAIKAPHLLPEIARRFTEAGQEEAGARAVAAWSIFYIHLQNAALEDGQAADLIEGVLKAFGPGHVAHFSLPALTLAPTPDSEEGPPIHKKPDATA